MVSGILNDLKSNIVSIPHTQRLTSKPSSVEAGSTSAFATHPEKVGAVSAEKER